jgi:crotonobetaine/carnitine-CoA ligase
MALGLRSLGVKDGAYVAVFMPNCPEMVIVIYALTKIGAVPALINAALRGSSIFGSQFLSRFDL